MLKKLIKKLTIIIGIILIILIGWIIISIRFGIVGHSIPIDIEREMVTSAMGEIGAISGALEIYNQEKGLYPSSLQFLIPNYVRNKDVLIDPWGNEYVYIIPGTHHKNGKPDVFSKGKNKITTVDPIGNDVDDITNWSNDRWRKEYRYKYCYWHVPFLPIKLKKWGTWDIIGSIDWGK